MPHRSPVGYPRPGHPRDAMRSELPLRLALGAVFCAIALSGAALAEPPRIWVGQVEGRSVRGIELLRNGQRQVVLGEDGWLFDFDPASPAVALQPDAGGFRPSGVMQLRAELVREFGPRYHVATTQHFVIVQPEDSDRRWPDRFEQLHRTFLSYFRVRGVRLREGNFPMVAIVHADRESFHRAVPRAGPQVLGIYDRRSNRIHLYEHGGGAHAFDTTICHEAAHQSAFNVGVHSRVAPTPHWIVEGIGCLFQAPALVAGHSGGDPRGRCDPQLLRLFEDHYSGDLPAFAAELQTLVRDDRPFRRAERTTRAYVASWALTFYLAERRETEFARLLETYAARPPFRNYPAAERARDFQSALGPVDLRLAKQIERFLQSL